METIDEHLEKIFPSVFSDERMNVVHDFRYFVSIGCCETVEMSLSLNSLNDEKGEGRDKTLVA